jgi:hypothetical protein
MIGEPYDVKTSRAVRRDRFATTANAMSKNFGDPTNFARFWNN